MPLLAIDPGNTESAYVIINNDRRPLAFDKIDNESLLLGLDLLHFTSCTIEMVSSYGMAVGEDVFHTVRWVGHFERRLIDRGHRPQLVKRGPIKLHHCHSTRAKDSNVRQALVDRFAPGQPNHGKGTKADPGWFHGFHADIWQAYALGVYAVDQGDGFQP